MKRLSIILIICSISLTACGKDSGITVTGDNATITTNAENNNAQAIVDTDVNTNVDVDNSDSQISETSIKDTQEYQQLQNQYNQLKEENSSLQNQIDELKSNQNNIPVIEYKDLGLSIDGEDIPINKNKSMVIINGYEYVSKEIADKLIQDGKNLSINNNILSVGKIVADKSNLFDKHVNDKSNCDFNDTHIDSFGNICSNVLVFNSNTSHKIIFVLDRKYTFLKFNASVSDYAYNDRTGVIVIKADNETVYTSENINKQTEPFPESDIAINNCSLLTIEYNSDFHNECLIYNAVVYN